MISADRIAKRTIRDYGSLKRTIVRDYNSIHLLHDYLITIPSDNETDLIESRSDLNKLVFTFGNRGQHVDKVNNPDAC